MRLSINQKGTKMKGLLKEPFGCTLCKKSFSQPMDLAKHFKLNHSPKSTASESPEKTESTEKTVNENKSTEKSSEKSLASSIETKGWVKK